jgi:hypothetical protein
MLISPAHYRQKGTGSHHHRGFVLLAYRLRWQTRVVGYGGREAIGLQLSFGNSLRIFNVSQNYVQLDSVTNQTCMSRSIHRELGGV